MTLRSDRRRRRNQGNVCPGPGLEPEDSIQANARLVAILDLRASWIRATLAQSDRALQTHRRRKAERGRGIDVVPFSVATDGLNDIKVETPATLWAPLQSATVLALGVGINNRGACERFRAASPVLSVRARSQARQGQSGGDRYSNNAMLIHLTVSLSFGRGSA